jgi:hypothetical protein
MGRVPRHPSDTSGPTGNAPAGIADGIMPDRATIAIPPEFEQRFLPSQGVGRVVFLQQIDEFADT